MKKFLAVLSTAAILSTSFSAMADEQLLTSLIDQMQSKSQVESKMASDQLLKAFQSKAISSGDLKNYLEVNYGPDAKKTIALINDVEANKIPMEKMTTEFTKAVNSLDGGAHFISESDCAGLGNITVWVAIGTGIAALANLHDVLSDSSDIRTKNTEIKQAELRIQQIKNDSSIPEASTLTMSSGSSSSVTSTNGGSSTVNHTSSTTITYTPPTKEKLIADQQAVIDSNNIDLIGLNDRISTEKTKLGVYTGLFLLTGGVTALCPPN